MAPYTTSLISRYRWDDDIMDLFQSNFQPLRQMSPSLLLSSCYTLGDVTALLKKQKLIVLWRQQMQDRYVMTLK